MDSYFSLMWKVKRDISMKAMAAVPPHPPPPPPCPIITDTMQKIVVMEMVPYL